MTHSLLWVAVAALIVLPDRLHTGRPASTEAAFQCRVNASTAAEAHAFREALDDFQAREAR